MLETLILFIYRFSSTLILFSKDIKELIVLNTIKYGKYNQLKIIFCEN